MRLWRFLVLVGIWAILAGPPEVTSCGPFLPTAQFTFLRGPVPQAADFAGGEIGVLRPGYYRRWLVIGYRYLAGAPLNADEVDALPRRIEVSALPYQDPVARWLSARNGVTGVDPIAQIDVYKRSSHDAYESYVNCLDSAFDTAVATLQDRSLKWGGTSTQLKEWVTGQDQVFANCSNGPSIPAALPAGSNALLAADRQYQIATAKFYAPQLDQAAQDFAEIGKNAVSPWRDAVPYLLARTSIRDATLNSNEKAWHDAEMRLQQILSDPAERKWHGPAQQLLDYVRARLYPDERLGELGAALMKPGLGREFAAEITDYTFLWDKLQKRPAAHDDLTDWIEAFQGGGTGEHAVGQWRKHQSAPWLVASLAWIAPDDPAAPDLIAAARHVKPDSPAYASAAYYGIRVSINRGETDSARQWLDEALGTRLPLAAHNMLFAERLKVARDWTEFLRYSLREPAAQTEYMEDEPPDSAEPTFDLDVTWPMNRQVPLTLWIDATHNQLLPRNIQTEVAQAGWVRAVLLEKNAEASQFAARIEELAPGMAADMRAYLAEKDAGAAKFSAVFFMLNTPGLLPVIRDGFGRHTELLDTLDDLRDNWWNFDELSLRPSVGQGIHTPLADLYQIAQVGPAHFMSAAQLNQGQAEWETLLKNAANGPDYLCAQTIQWVRAHLTEPRAAEALHLAVRATRYSTTDARTGDYSKAAFDLLHAHYPNSKWAQMTPYWYK